MTPFLAALIPWFPALGAVGCGICCTRKAWRNYAGWICVVSIALSFVVTLIIWPAVMSGSLQSVHAFEWMAAGPLVVNFAYLFDPLTLIMLFVVTGIGTLVAIYATGYMAGDCGYARFFAGVSLFIFAMTNLVMADNLVLLYLGWEGVGLCSYLLIGYYYDKPSAVAAAKKAFIVNRIGDLGFAIGIFLCYTQYNTLVISDIVHVAAASDGHSRADTWIPFMLMLGAFGKSAQLPLHVWLPDAMEGPTPVSALIHAATMVTAGVYMIARLIALFELSPYALPTVATIGGLTALFAATIALCQYDIKRIYAYSTVSQLGYMFLGVGVLSTAGGVFHLFTHAFFKALLFLTAGSVMHALAGQLDLRKMSGLRTKMPVTCWLMFAGCLSLAGFPLITAGFWSKDLILAATIEKGLTDHMPWFVVLGVIGLVTALLTAFYTFRLWFRVFLGPTQYKMGDEHHDNHDEHPADNADDADVHVQHVHDAHEMPWVMNGPLVLLAVGAILAGLFGGRLEGMIDASTASTAAHAAAEAAHPAEAAHGVAFSAAGTAATPSTEAGHEAGGIHKLMMLISGIISIVGILAAAYFHWLNRDAATEWAERFPKVVRTLANKYYVDELYDAIIVRPLRGLGYLCYLIDRLIIDGLVAFAGFVPRAIGLSVQPSQSGALQGYGLGMAAGAAVILGIVLYAKYANV